MTHPKADGLENPDFENAGRVHDWRNYAGEKLREIWPTFNAEQREAIYETLDSIAGDEQWD